MSEMMWNGKELKTMGDVMDAAMTCKTKEDAYRFYREYKLSVDGDENIVRSNFKYGFAQFTWNKEWEKFYIDLFELNF